MKRIELFDLTTQDLPIGVRPIQTAEGNDGYGLFASYGERVVMEDGSYGYDTAFLESTMEASRKKAQLTAEFLNRVLTNQKPVV